MTQEEKELLLRDLCARLPYETWVQYEGKEWLVTGYGHGRVSLLPSVVSSICGPCPLVEEVRTYLRPMSSMTEEEKEYIKHKWCYNDWDINGPSSLWREKIDVEDAEGIIDYFNEHHFDFRGLIEKGLAIEAKEEMY